MLSKLWTTLKRVTVGERLKEVGRATGKWGAAAGVDVRRVSDGSTCVTLSLSSNVTFELNNRTTIYAYLDDKAAEKVAADLLQAIKQRSMIA